MVAHRAHAVQYDFGSSQTNRFNFGARATARAGQGGCLTYRFSRELVDQVGGQSELKQTYLAAEWPIYDNWTFVGAWNYSIPGPEDAGGGGGGWSTMAGAGRCAW